MNEIGTLLKTTRETSGVSIKEASEDLQINEIILENIEDGNIGCFKDIFELKENIKEYAKYLGLDAEEIIDEFNDYMFDYTSKIPMAEIQKAVNEKEKQDTKERKIISPYTKKQSLKKREYLLYIGFSSLILVIIFIIFFIIKTIFF